MIRRIYLADIKLRAVDQLLKFWQHDIGTPVFAKDMGQRCQELYVQQVIISNVRS